VPIDLKPPRQGKTPYYSGRGTYLGVYVDRTTKTADKRQAQQIINGWKRQIESGEYQRPVEVKLEAAVESAELTFATAALAYLRAGGEATYLAAIIEQTGEHALRDKPCRLIDQTAIDNAAAALYPDAPATTKNRQFYTPVSAVLKRAGFEREVKRPKGWRGKKSQSWLQPAQAFELLGHAADIDAEFGLFCLTLLYTGERLSEPLRCELRHLMLDQAMLYVPDTKNGLPRPVHLPPIVINAFRTMPPRPERLGGRSQDDAGVPFLERDGRKRLFRFHVGGHLRDMLTEAMRRTKLSFPPREGGFHLFCHTYGTWMKRFGGLDTDGLVRTGRWKDPSSAARYAHTMTSPEAQRADLLPVPFQMAKVKAIGAA
jgi:integrase